MWIDVGYEYLLAHCTCISTLYLCVSFQVTIHLLTSVLLSPICFLMLQIMNMQVTHLELRPVFIRHACHKISYTQIGLSLLPSEQSWVI